MKTKIRESVLGAALLLAGTLSPVSAFAYIGPGAGLSAIGTVIAFLAAVILGIVGFVWYPLKRILRKRRRSDEQAKEAEGDGQNRQMDKPEDKTDLA